MRIMAKTSIKKIMEYWNNSEWQLKQVLNNWPERSNRELRHFEILIDVCYTRDSKHVCLNVKGIKNYSVAKAIWNNRLFKLIDKETISFSVLVYYVTPISKKCIEIHESFWKEANNG